MQVFDAVGWQPKALKTGWMQLFDAVGWQPTAVKGLG